MNPIRKHLALAALAVATLGSVQGCIPVIVGGTGMAVAMVSDRRSSGTYVEDEGIEWKAGKWISDRLGDKVHVNATAFNRKLLLTGEAFNEESREEAGRLATSVENVREVINELRVAPTSSLGNRANDSYISSKVKARFVDQKDFHIQQVKVVTEAGTTYLMGLVTERDQALVDLGGDVANALVDDFAFTLVERAQRPLQVDLVGDDVRGTSGLYASDREHALLVVERDEPRHELRGGRYGVFQLRAHGAVQPRRRRLAQHGLRECDRAFRPGPYARDAGQTRRQRSRNRRPVRPLERLAGHRQPGRRRRQLRGGRHPAAHRVQ